MFRRLFRRPRRDHTAHLVYARLVTLSRRPVFYTTLAVPDTREGRFEMIVLHAVLYFLRLDGAGAEAAARAQQVFDVFLNDLDGALREMGVGDLAVPRQMRKLGEAFYGRAAAYRDALGDRAGPHDLSGALARNIYDGRAAPENVEALARYVRASVGRLARQDLPALLAGRIELPDPADFLQGVER